MNLKKFLVSIILLNITMSLFCIKIFLANINFIQENADVLILEEEKKSTELIFNSIKKRDTEGLIRIQLLPKTISFENRLIKSSIDASEICDILNIDYLLYGYIEKTNKYYNAEIRLFENAEKKDKKIFFIKIELGDFNEVISDISYKFNDYMIKVLGLTEYQQERRRGFGGIGIYNGAGFWFPIGDWWNVQTGLFSYDVGFFVIPITPIYKNRVFGFSLRLGLFAGYSFGISKPGYLKSYISTIQLNIPLICSFELYFNHVLNIGAAPQMQINVTYQKKIFDDPETFSTVAMSIMANAGYEYWFTKRKITGIGINNIFNFTFYENMYFDYKIELYNVVRIPVIKKKK